MVGEGRRFREAGFSKKKPLVQVKNKTIVEHAVDSFGVEGNYIFVIKKDESSEELKSVLKRSKPGCKIVETENNTDGSVSSILLASDLINTDDALITTNCDQVLYWDSTLFTSYCEQSGLDGVVATYPFDDIKLCEESPYSFVISGLDGLAEELVEKRALSFSALCGIHFWKTGKLFVESAEDLIQRNERVKNEFYVSQAYNSLIKRKNGKVGSFPLSPGQFFSLGTPEDVEKYENSKIE